MLGGWLPSLARLTLAVDAPKRKRAPDGAGPSAPPKPEPAP